MLKITNQIIRAWSTSGASWETLVRIMHIMCGFYHRTLLIMYDFGHTCQLSCYGDTTGTMILWTHHWDNKSECDDFCDHLASSQLCTRILCTGTCGAHHQHCSKLIMSTVYVFWHIHRLWHNEYHYGTASSQPSKRQHAHKRNERDSSTTSSRLFIETICSTYQSSGLNELINFCT